MHGPLGGELSGHGDGAGADRERLPSRFILGHGGAQRSIPQLAGDVELITLETELDAGDAGGTIVRYDHAFTGWKSLLEGPEPRAALLRVVEAVAVLHGQGLVHGDLGPRVVGWREVDDADPSSARLALLVRSRGAAGGELARSLVLAGIEPLSSMAYVAPEILEGGAPDAASDVYALAAMIHRVLTGKSPLGQIEGLPPMMRAALSGDPRQRPPPAALAATLRDELHEAPSGAPAPRTRGLGTPVQREALRADSAQMSTMLLVLLVLGGAFVFFGAIWLVSTNWGALGQTGHFVLLLALTLGAAVAGTVLERRGYDGTGMTLTLLASCLLWADAAYILDIQDSLSKTSAWAVAAACVTLASAALLGVKRGPLHAWVTAIDVAIFAACLGDVLASGNPPGPALYAALVAAAFSFCAVGASFLRPRALPVLGSAGAAALAVSLGLPFAVFAVVCTWLSAGAALFLFSESAHDLFATAWPYLLLAPAALLAWRAPTLYRWCALAALAPLLLLTPTVEALVNHDSAAYLAVPLGAGFVALAALAVAPANDVRDLARAILGIVNVGAAATLLALIKCSDVATDEVLAAPLLTYFLAWIVGSLGLALFGYVASGRAVSKPVYRVVEVTGLLELFAVGTVISLFRPEDTFFPALVFGSATILLAAGLATRRASLLLAAASALLVNLSLQYFVRLHHLLPTAVLIIGFGVVLLGLGLAYERRLKRLLPMLRAWS